MRKWKKEERKMKKREIGKKDENLENWKQRKRERNKGRKDGRKEENSQKAV